MGTPSNLTNLKALACGNDFALALLDNGNVTAWGYGPGFNNLPSLTGVKAISAGFDFGLALLDNGTVVAWGSNLHGESVPPNGLTGVAGIASGAYHGLAQLSNGTVTAWGSNVTGETTVPSGLADVIQVQGGNDYSEALLSNGTVQAWGTGQTPATPPAVSDCTFLYASYFNTGALCSPIMQSISVSSPSVTFGNFETVTLTVSPISTVLGETVQITGTGPCSFPSSVQLRNESSFSFQIVAPAVATTTSQTVTATLNGTTVTGSFSVVALKVISASFAPSYVEGAGLSSLDIILNGTPGPGGADITLQSTGPWSIPSSVNVGQGQNVASVPVATTAVSSAVVESVTVTYNGSSKTTSFTTTPASIQSISAYPSTVVGGASTDITVVLDSAAGPSGDLITLSNGGDATLKLPATVKVPAGENSVSFTATTSPTSSPDQVNVSAALGSNSLLTPVLVNPPTVSRVLIAPASVAGGTSVEATLELNGPAPTGGQIVFLSSSTGAVTPPASITIPAKAAAFSFLLKTTAVNTSTPTSLTASVNSVSLTGSVTVLPAGVSSVIVQPTVQGGTSEEVGVYLASPAGPSGVTVSLSSNNSALVTPASIKFPSGYSSYWYVQKTSGVSTSTAVKITATVGSSSVSGTTTLTPASLSSLTLSRSTIAAGTETLATVALTGPAGSSGTVVSLSSGNPAIAGVPGSIQVNSGSNSASFAITASGVNASTSLALTATLGSVSRTAGLTVTPATLQQISLSGLGVTGGSPATFTLNLTGPAGPAGVVVHLSSSSSVITVPASVTITSGNSSTQFTASTKAVTSNTSVTVTATQGNYSSSVSVPVKT